MDCLLFPPQTCRGLSQDNQGDAATALGSFHSALSLLACLFEFGQFQVGFGQNEDAPSLDTPKIVFLLRMMISSLMHRHIELGDGGKL